jgi:pimeloyl-ACP methyl ester carboxylesterase
MAWWSRVRINPDQLLREIQEFPGEESRRRKAQLEEIEKALERYRWTLGLVKRGTGESALNEVHYQMREPMEKCSAALIEVASALDEASWQLFQRIREDRHGSISVHQVHAEDRADRVADLIFFHGLDGDPFTTWCHDQVRPNNSWPYWLADDLPKVGVWLYDYPAASSGWWGHSLSLKELAQTAMHKLRAAELDSRSIIFVAHSLGGLVIKEMARLARNQQSAEHQYISKLLRGIVFLATPHTGAGLATAVGYARSFYRATPVVEALRQDDAYTRELAQWFSTRFHVEYPHVEVRSYRETMPLKGLVMVVDETSANPRVDGVELIPVERRDHIMISKCRAPTEIVYTDVNAMLRRIIEPARAADLA